AGSGSVTSQVYTPPTLTSSTATNGTLTYGFNGQSFSVGGIELDSNVVNPITMQIALNFTGTAQFAPTNGTGVTLTGSGSTYQLTGSTASIKAYVANSNFLQLTPAADSSAPGSVTVTATADGVQKTWSRNLTASSGPALTTTTPLAAPIAVAYNGAPVSAGSYNVSGNALQLSASLDLGTWPGSFMPGSAVGAMVITPPPTGSHVWTFSGPRADMEAWLNAGVGTLSLGPDVVVPPSVLTVSVSGAGLTQTFTRNVAATSSPTNSVSPSGAQSLNYLYTSGTGTPVAFPSLNLTSNSVQGSILVNATGLVGVGTYTAPPTMPNGSTFTSVGITVTTVNGVTTFSGPTSALATLAGQSVGTFQPSTAATGSGSATVTIQTGPSAPIVVPVNFALSGTLQLTGAAAANSTYLLTGGTVTVSGTDFVGGSGVNTTVAFNTAG
ncbi:MAG: hypothetical protein AAB066_05010, partial [Candidatus Margulisiibacteriota bacterium]